MAVIKMTALTLVGPRSEIESSAQLLALAGNFQPLSLDALVNDMNLRSKVTTETVNPYDELLAKISSVWEASGRPLPQPVSVPPDKSFTLTSARYSVDKAVAKFNQLQTQKLALTNEKAELEAAEKILSAVQGTDFSVSELIGNEFICARFELLKPENYKRLQTAGSDYTAEMAAEIARQKEENSRQLETFTEETDKLLDGSREQLEQLYLRLYAMQRVYDVCRGRGEVSGLFFISGWLPSDSVDEIKAEIERGAPSTSILLDDTKELNVSAPVLLKNKRIFRAFQDIVALYSLPSYDEFDPSAFVALTFALFFGFMFGDVGHGLLIYLAAVWAQKKGFAPRSAAFIMKCAAASSMFFGVLYGSIFGQEDVIPALWLSPIKDTGSLIATSIAVGFAIISAGILLNIARQFRDRNFGSMLFDGQGIAGLAFYWSVAAFALARISDTGSDTLLFALKLTAVLSVLLIAFKSTFARLLFKETPKSSTATDVFGIIEVVLSMLSNTVSFVRLAAFALNHVCLSMAVIMLSEMVRNLPGGIFMKFLLLAAGNVLVVALEGLIVFIQTLRLEYYEFFGKFYKGGGKAFSPVQWKN